MSDKLIFQGLDIFKKSATSKMRGGSAANTDSQGRAVPPTKLSGVAWDYIRKNRDYGTPTVFVRTSVEVFARS